VSRGSPHSEGSGPENVRDRKDFARELTRLRVRVGLTVREVAKIVDVPPATTGDYFGGAHLPPLKPPVLARILTACGVVEAAEIERWQQALVRVRRTPGRRPTGAPFPYRGLASFQPEHAEWFHGREDLTRHLVQCLTDRYRSGKALLVAVGPSGSGKSSVLRAGLIPALRSGGFPVPRSSGWPVLLFTPGAHPVRELAERLAAFAGVPAGDLAMAMREDPARCTAIIRAAVPDSDQRALPLGGPDPAVDDVTAPDSGQPCVVLVVDQFEETFTACADEAERHAFVDTLFAASGGDPLAATGREGEDAAPAAVVVLGLRADFYGHTLRYPPLVAAMQDAQVVVGPMTESELRRAIVEPARLAKFDLEDGLVEVLLRDLAPTAQTDTTAAHDAGALPMLSHALQSTWQRSQRGRMTVADYRDSGGIRGAVANSADEVYDDLSNAEQVAARHVFVRLVRVAEDAADTRRRLARSALTSAGGVPPADVEQVLDRFIEQRLITADADMVEITHEALIQAWPRLREWIDNDRVGLRTAQQLGDAAEAWDREQRDPTALYHGTRLAIARDWADAGRRHQLSALANEFLDAGVRRERRRTNRVYQVIAGLATLSLLAASASVIAFQQRSEALAQRSTARDERNRAISRLVAARADRLRATDVSLAMQLSLAAYRINPTTEALSSLLDSSATPSATRLLGHTDIVHGAAVSLDKRILASGSGDKTVRLWDMTNPQRPVPLGTPLTGPTGGILSVAFSPDGHTLAAGSSDKTVYLWNLSDPRRAVPLGPPLTGPTDEVLSIAFSPDGHTLAAGGDDKAVHLWNLRDPQRSAHRAVPLAEDANAVTFSPDGHVLAVGSADHTVHLLDIADPLRPVAAGVPLVGPTGEVRAVAFSPDGKLLAAGSTDRTVRVWNISDPTHPSLAGSPLSGPASWVYSVAFSPDGNEIAAANADNTVYVWHRATGRVTATLPHPGPVTAVAYGLDSGTLISGATDGTVRMWSLPGPLLTDATDAVFTVAFNVDGQTLAVASGDERIRLWDVTDPRRPVPLGKPLTAVGSSGALVGTVAFGPGGRLAAGRDDGTVQLWDLIDPRHPTVLPAPSTGLTGVVESVTFSANGQIMAAGSSAGGVQIWDSTDLRRPAALATLPTTPGSSTYSVAFSPNGTTLAAASADNTVWLWDVTNPGQPMQLGPPLTGFDGAAYHVLFSPDGHTLAAGSADGTVRRWDLTNPSQPVPIGKPVTGPEGFVYAVAFSPNGHILATANTDKTVWLWNLAQEPPGNVAVLTGPTNTVFSVALASDGRTLAAGSQDRTVRLWDINPHSVADYICAVAGDPITQREWQRYIPGFSYDPPCTPPR